MAKRKWKPISDEGVLELLRSGKYSVDLETGDVSNAKGHVLSTFQSRTALAQGRGEYKFVYLFVNGNQRRGIAVHKLVWMAGSDCCVPVNFEVHHEDEDTQNNAYSNLFALHKNDHLKVHGNWATATKELDDEEFPEGDVPF